MQGRDRSIAGFVRRLRWIMIAGIFAVVIGYQWLKESVLDFSATDRLIYGILLYACLGSVVTWFALTWVSNRIAQGERAEKKVREEEMYVASIAASSADAILSMDPNGTITSWNKGAEVIFCYKDKDIIELTQKYTQVLEEIIRKYPSQWLWMHKRWKSRPTSLECRI